VSAGQEPSSLEALMEKASRVGGGRTWADLSFRPTVELLLGSCRETAALDERGRRVLDSIVVRHLVNRLLLEADAAERPAAVARPVGPAVVVTGLPRTGTTLLHNLLALDPGSRPLRFWEALHPVPPNPEQGASEAELVSQAATWLERLYDLVPAFRTIHASTAEGPEECDALLQNDFASQHFDDMFDARDYSAWYATAPLRAEYRSYARQLSGLRRAEDGDRPWALKSPSHLGHLDALLEACPEATVVHCHRDPAAAVASYASLMICLRRAYSEDVSPGVVGRQALHRCEVALRRAMAVRRQAPGRFLDVGYDELVRRPAATVGRLYEQLGRPLPAGMEAEITTFVSRHPQHEHGVHRYTPADFDLTESAIDRAFGDYEAEHLAAGA
jgi:hypothetical protein